MKNDDTETSGGIILVRLINCRSSSKGSIDERIQKIIKEKQKLADNLVDGNFTDFTDDTAEFKGWTKEKFRELLS